jgi:hypothetical protein
MFKYQYMQPVLSNHSVRVVISQVRSPERQLPNLPVINSITMVGAFKNTAAWSSSGESPDKIVNTLNLSIKILARIMARQSEQKRLSNASGPNRRSPYLAKSLKLYIVNGNVNRKLLLKAFSEEERPAHINFQMPVFINRPLKIIQHLQHERQ